jgi:hypothetical protein
MLLRTLVTLCMLSALFAFSADAQTITTHDGWVGNASPYVCTDVECTESSGCSYSFYSASQYDWYWEQTRCADSSGENWCSQSYELCRETQFFTASGCSGVVEKETQNYYGACG